MTPFKFFRNIKTPRKSPGLIKLKDVFNRNKFIVLLWSEYPYDGDDSNILTFQGNVLDFYNYYKTQGVSPTVYEIYKQYRGQMDTTIVYSNRHRFNPFIARKYYLTIKYTL